jgi:hypothetical protein
MSWKNESENTFNIKPELKLNFDNCVNMMKLEILILVFKHLIRKVLFHIQINDEFFTD